MMKKILILLFLTYFSSGYAQNIGDFRSRNWTVDIGSGAQGRWTDYRSWQIYNGSNWVDAVTNQYPGQTAYQGRNAPVFRAEDRVALGANLYREGNYTITLQQPEGIFAGRQAVYLKDHETGRMTNLSEQPYTFATKAGMVEGRFEVLYQPQAKHVASESAKDGAVVYRDGTLYVIKSREDISLIEVYDGAGRMVHTERPGREEVSINTEHYPKGVFFLKIHTGGSVITKKVLH